MDDAAILAGLEGDPDAFAVFYRRHDGRLLDRLAGRFVLRELGEAGYPTVGAITPGSKAQPRTVARSRAGPRDRAAREASIA